MSVFSVRRAVAVVGAVVLSGVVFAVPASAADLPLVGTPECDSAVAGAPAVISARAAVDVAKGDVDTAAEGVVEATATRDAAQALVDEAGVLVTQTQIKALAAAVKNLGDATTAKVDADAALTKAQMALGVATEVATNERCTDTASDEPTTTPAPTTTPDPTEQADPDVVAARIAAQIDTLSCDDYRDELAAIRGALLDTDTQTLLGAQRVGELLERLRLRNAAINSCVSPAPAPVVGNDRDCADFATPADAQRFFLAVRTVANPDPSRLDSNGNGIACESSEVVVSLDPLADDDSVANATQIRVVPQGSASTGG